MSHLGVSRSSHPRNIFIAYEMFFARYPRYCPKAGNIVFIIPDALYESGFMLLAWLVPVLDYLSMLYIHVLVCIAYSAE